MQSQGPIDVNDSALFQGLVERVDWLLKQAMLHYQRRMIVLSGNATWCRATAADLLTRLPNDEGLWIGEAAPDGMTCLDNNAAERSLGAESGLLVYDTFCGLDVNAFGAVCGTLRGGGLLILLTPQLTFWPRYADPQHTRITVAGYPASAVTGRFLKRLVRLLKSDPSILLLEENQPLPQPLPTATQEYRAVFQDPACRTADQRAAVEAVCHVVNGHRRRPVVLISDRGRGKSSALGIAAARLAQQGSHEILVTASRTSAVSPLLHCAAKLLPSARLSKGSIHWGDCHITYVAPDHLLQHPQPADMLLVDEAAAIPTPLLESLLAHYPRIAFATTIHGYEGTGRGFALRFRQVLDRRTPQWREIHLETPIRWAKDDPLERWLFRALALNASPPEDALVRDARAEDCVMETLDRDLLVDTETDLNDLFGLLVTAHYRTTPFDLRHLLDGPNLSVSVLRYQGRIVATALVAQEGGFDQATAHAIWAGYRRPRGHLLAQSLAAHVGLESAACLRGARIMRIAVHPALQQRGLGGRLLQAIADQARHLGLDYLGASFGATAVLLDFWHSNGLEPVRIGLRRGASSGTQSVIVLRALTDQGEAMVTMARQRFFVQLPRLLTEPLRDMEPELALGLLARSEFPFAPDAQDWLDLLGFAFAQRSYETSLGPLETMTLKALSQGQPALHAAKLLVMKILQHRSWDHCARQLGLAGRAGVEAELRSLLRELVLHYGDEELKQQALKLEKFPPATYREVGS